MPTWAITSMVAPRWRTRRATSPTSCSARTATGTTSDPEWRMEDGGWRMEDGGSILHPPSSFRADAWLSEAAQVGVQVGQVALREVVEQPRRHQRGGADAPVRDLVPG